MNIKTRLIEIPEAALAQAGLDAFKADATESSLQQILAADQVDALLKVLEDTEEAKQFPRTNVLTRDGQQAAVSMMDEQVIDGTNRRLSPEFEFVPVISADKTAVDVTLKAHINLLAPKPQ